MKWKTRISTHKEDGLEVEGKRLLDLVGKSSFTEVVFLLLQKRMPNEQETAMLDTLLVSAVEHGIAAPSAFVPRVIASTGNPVNAALASGMLAIGDFHGGAIEECARHLASDKDAGAIVQEIMAKGGAVPGLGHKVYKDKDPRAEAIFIKAKELGFGETAVAKLHAIQSELAKQLNRTLPINIDGAIAAVMTELGFDYRLGKAIFALGRMPGMIAHIFEEMKYEKPYRRLDDEDVEYIGGQSAS